MKDKMKEMNEQLQKRGNEIWMCRKYDWEELVGKRKTVEQSSKAYLFGHQLL
jgi:hypothetical protein